MGIVKYAQTGEVGAMRETGGRGEGNEKQRRVSYFCLNAFCEE